MSRRVCRYVINVYLLLYLVSLVAAVVGTRGMFGLTPDSFLAAYLVMLGMPWVLVLTVAEMPEALGLFIVGIAPLVNYLIATWLCSRRKRSRGGK